MYVERINKGMKNECIIKGFSGSGLLPYPIKHITNTDYREFSCPIYLDPLPPRPPRRREYQPVQPRTCRRALSHTGLLDSRLKIGSQ